MRFELRFNSSELYAMDAYLKQGFFALESLDALNISEEEIKKVSPDGLLIRRLIMLIDKEIYVNEND